MFRFYILCVYLSVFWFCIQVLVERGISFSESLAKLNTDTQANEGFYLMKKVFSILLFSLSHVSHNLYHIFYFYVFDMCVDQSCHSLFTYCTQSVALAVLQFHSFF